MLRENIKAAMASIRSARFRSFLTMLGVIIGVTSVITTASLGEGVKRQVTGYTRGVGSDLITVRPGNVVRRDDKGNITSVNLLSFLASKSLSDRDVKLGGLSISLSCEVSVRWRDTLPGRDKKDLFDHDTFTIPFVKTIQLISGT